MESHWRILKEVRDLSWLGFGKVIQGSVEPGAIAPAIFEAMARPQRGRITAS